MTFKKAFMRIFVWRFKSKTENLEKIFKNLRGSFCLIVLLILVLSVASIPVMNFLGIHPEKLIHRILYSIYTLIAFAIVAAVSWIVGGSVARAQYKKDTDTEILDEFVPEIPKIYKEIHPLAKDAGRKLEP